MRSSVRALLCAALLLAAACDSPAGSGNEKEPEQTPWGELPPLAVTAQVNGTVQPGKFVEYALVQPAASFRLIFEMRGGGPADSLVAEIMDAQGRVLSTVVGPGGTTETRPRIGIWMTPAAGELRVRVRGQRADDGGAFMVGVGLGGANPEWVAAAIQPGQVVEGEDIEGESDVDEFRVTGQEGDEWIVFAHAAPEWTHLVVELLDAGSGKSLARFGTEAPASVLEGASGGRVVLPASGTYVVRVTSPGFWRPGWTGQYRLKVYPVNRAPEAGPAAVQLGAVVSESIGEVGDADEYTFTAQAGQEMNLLLQIPAQVPGSIHLALTHGTQTVATLEAREAIGSLDEYGTGRIVLPADGEYRVRVSGAAYGTAATAAGSYRFELYPVNRAPENGAQLGLDTPPAAGAIERPGDIDEFTFQGTAGQHVVIHISSAAPTTAGVLYAGLLDPAGEALVTAVNFWASSSAGNRYSNRIRLDATGTYRLQVNGGVAWSYARGPYTVQAYTIDPAPEHVPAAVRVGQTVTGERIDRPGDLDLFTLTGPEGTQANLFLGSPIAAGVPATVRAPSHPFAFIHVHSQGTALDSISTGRFTMESGAHEIAVNAYSLNTEHTGRTGEYSFRVWGVDRAPEGRSAAYTLGDTVTSELLYPAGDVDEYLFTLGAARRIGMYWDTPAAMGPDDAVAGRLVAVASNQVVWHSWSTPRPAFLDLPAGAYRFEVMNPNFEAPLQVAPRAHLRYTFALIP
jgi:hypothetical protein